MSMSTEEKIRHYQRSIDRSIGDKKRLLHCIETLSKLPVTVQHLQVTGIGRTVNALRKIENGVGNAAKRLVAKWKIMVENTDTSDEEDEACVPDVPESYESPECDSEPEIKQNRSSNILQPEALRRPLLSPSMILDEDILSNTPPCTSNNHVPSEDEEKISCINEDSKRKSKKSKSSEQDSKQNNSKQSSNKDRSSKRDSKSSKDKYSYSKDKHELSKDIKNNIKDPEPAKLKKNDNSKNKIESSSTHSTKSKKYSSDRKRKCDSSSSDADNDIKRKKKSDSEVEDEDNEENFVICDERLEEEAKDKRISSDNQLKVKESSLKGVSHGDKDKLKEKHRNSSGHSKSKKHDSSEKLKKDEKHLNSKLNDCSKEKKRKSDEHHLKESLKSTPSSSSSRDHSKVKDKEKQSKNKAKESNSKNTKEEESNVNKNDRKRSNEIKEVKEHKDSKLHKSQKENKDKKKVKKNGAGGIDCNSGTSFADALGMCTMPPPSKKKKENTFSNLSKPIKIEQSQTSTSPITPSSSKCSGFKIKYEPDSPESLPLLSSNIKLEPLSRIDEEVDLASTLPEPSLHYKPLPHLNHAQRRQDEDNMLSQVIYAKNQRTKVYSGNKIGYTNVPSLYEMCIRVLIENIDALEFTGGVPYYIIKPVLERATPDQLFILEHHNPYLIEDSDPLWKFHCSKDFRSKQREEMESWREMYMRCLDEREAKLKALTANIKQSIDKSTPVRSTKLAYVDNVVKPPRNVLRKQAKYGTANSSNKASDLKKKLIIASAKSNISSGNSVNTVEERISVPPPPIARVRPPTSTMKKTKAPLMAKALQAIKGRYKR